MFVKLLSRKKGSALVKSFTFRFAQQELGSAFTSVAAPGYNKGWGLWCFVTLYATVGGKFAPRESAKSLRRWRRPKVTDLQSVFASAFYGRLLISLRLKWSDKPRNCQTNRTAGHLVFWKPWPAVSLEQNPSVTTHRFVLYAQRKLSIEFKTTRVFRIPKHISNETS